MIARSIVASITNPFSSAEEREGGGRDREGGRGRREGRREGGRERERERGRRESGTTMSVGFI